MDMSDLDLIIGVHSVAAALKNPKRNIKKLVATEEGRDELRKKCDFSKVDVQLVSSHKLQEEAKKSLQ
ncbi:MAG: RNA methyltransferase substrate-binding domain-containing protein, partial [Bacteriovoracaceae bacterium]